MVKSRNLLRKKCNVDRRMVLKLALLSLIESMGKDPDKYSQLIYRNTPSTANYNSQNYDAASYVQQQQQYPSQAYTDMLLEEAEKLYNKLAKELGDEIIGDCLFSTASSLLPPPEERQSHPTTTTTTTTTTAAANQTPMHTEKHRFSQSEIDDDN